MVGQNHNVSSSFKLRLSKGNRLPASAWRSILDNLVLFSQADLQQQVLRARHVVGRASTVP